MVSNANLSIPDAPWYLHNLWTNGHIGIVRSLLWDEEVGHKLYMNEHRTNELQNNVLVTGGEDTKINAWSCLTSHNKVEVDAMEIDPAPQKRTLDIDEEPVRVGFHKLPRLTVSHSQEGKRAKRSHRAALDVM